MVSIEKGSRDGFPSGWQWLKLEGMSLNNKKRYCREYTLPYLDRIHNDAPDTILCSWCEERVQK